MFLPKLPETNDLPFIATVAGDVYEWSVNVVVLQRLGTIILFG